MAGLSLRATKFVCVDVKKDDNIQEVTMLASVSKDGRVCLGAICRTPALQGGLA